MKNLILEVEAEGKRQQEDLQRYKVKLKELPKGLLSISSRGSRNYYSKIQGGKKTYLGKENNVEIIALQKRYFLEESISRITGNLTAINHLISKYKSLNPVEILSSAPKAYSRFSGVQSLLNREPWTEAWENAPYDKSKNYTNSLIHRTVKGEYVRSKSEVLIANALMVNGIPYHYEELWEVGGVTISPDFTILVSRENKFVIWEHFGMISDEDYLKRCMRKIQLYLEGGYRLWDNLIITFDTINGGIDTQIIEDIINTFLNPSVREK